MVGSGNFELDKTNYFTPYAHMLRSFSQGSIMVLGLSHTKHLPYWQVFPHLQLQMNSYSQYLDHTTERLLPLETAPQIVAILE